jgi:hypothetical protein
MKKTDDIVGIKEICQQILEGKNPKMSEAQIRIITRYQIVVDYYKEIKTTKPELQPYSIRSEVKKKIVQECGVSLFQAGIDYFMATQYFNLGTTLSKKELNIEIQLHENADYIEKCVANGDMKEAALFERNRIELLKMQKENVSYDWTEIPLPEIKIQFNPKLLSGNSVTQSLTELYDEIKEIEKSLELDSKNYKSDTLLSLFDISDVEYEEIENDGEEEE